MRVIHVLRKPLSEKTVAANTLKHGCGGLNIDASRIGSGHHLPAGRVTSKRLAGDGGLGAGAGREGPREVFTPHSVSGRWPANVILQHLDGCRCDGVKRVKPSNGSGRAGAGSSGFRTSYVGGDAKGAGFTGGSVKDDGKESVANWICEPGCPVARLDEQSGVTKGVVRQPTGKAVYPTDGVAVNWNSNSVIDNTVRGFGDTGGASRFYKQVGGKVSE